MKQKDKLLTKYFTEHQYQITQNIFIIMTIYLTLSIFWNVLFTFFDLPYSRANVSYLVTSLLIVLLLRIIFIWIPSMYLPHFILLYALLLFTLIYFSSGYGESWSYFLLMPILAGLFSSRTLLIYYSLIGLMTFSIISFFFPIGDIKIDAIDLSNRLLLYIIISTFSYLLFSKLFQSYRNQVNIIIESMESTLEQTVKSFIIAIEAKDQYTFGHSERVSLYAVEIGKKISDYNDEQNLNRLRLSGLVHDIGKINIPEVILTSTERLTKEEFEVVKTHPIVGARMVERVSSLELLKPGVLYHHERWDGKGYPSGIQEKEIPLDARVIAIADALDAMTTTRAYREALSFDEAFKRLNRGKGTQFDPYLIDIVNTIKPRLQKVYETSYHELRDLEQITDFI
ncbi:HD-GYP domain-containing protein [Halalkalibacter urbisdiaboli]|uniref:HD-GYP domain-containing protein n=1 Tax=Halalkalibacter urbisdiaboli TaxID=1960589 RepID=UPI001FDA7313|nr:HD-GYP domain-containing protein [Halalkalibacter urbisdiaboli]